jgi:hypothetical protein
LAAPVWAGVPGVAARVGVGGAGLVCGTRRLSVSAAGSWSD